METFLVRLWVPDRPGALGAVASRIGAVRGDVVGIDILERGAGRAIDELVVELPDASLVSLLIAEVAQVDGVDVEDVRPAAGDHDPRLDALRTAAVLVGAATTTLLLDELVGRARIDFEADWVVVVVDGSDDPVLATQGDAPADTWLAAFVSGSRSSAALGNGGEGPDDVAWAQLEDSSMSLVLGRAGRPFRGRERRQLEAVAAIAGRRALEVAGRPAVAIKA